MTNMDGMKQSHDKPLYLQVKEYLHEMITAMSPEENRLPPEETLAEKLGISRATVREAMSSLIKEGAITRWQGKGNFGHPSVSNLKMRIDLNPDFKILLESAGYAFSVAQTEFTIHSASSQMQSRMKEAEGEKVFAFQLIYKGDGKPLIICNVEILRSRIRKLPRIGQPERRFSDFLKKYCQADITHSATWIRAAVDEDIARNFSIHPESPLVVWDEIFFDLYDKKISYNQIFFHPEKIDLSMLLGFSVRQPGM